MFDTCYSLVDQKQTNKKKIYARNFQEAFTMAHIQGKRDLTLTHLSGPRLGMVTVSSGWSNRTLILEQLGSSLVQMLIGTIQLGQSSPGTHTQYTQTMSKRKAGIPALGLGTYVPSFHSIQKSNFVYNRAFTVPVKICRPMLKQQRKIGHSINL